MKIQSIFTILFLTQLNIAKASFFQGQLRYISGHEFSQRISDLGIKLINGSNCLDMNFQNKINFQNLGANPPSLGKPLFASPTAGTVQVLSECVVKNMSLYSYSEEELGSFISNEFQKAVHLAHPFFQTKKNQLMIKWSQVPSQEKYFLVAGLVEKILGTDPVIEDYGLIQSAESFRHEILNQLELLGSDLSLENVIQKIVVTLILRDEFLSY